MIKYIFNRIILIFITLFLILSITFLLLKKAPENTPVGTPEQIEAYNLRQVALGYKKIVGQDCTTVPGTCVNVYENTPIMQQYGIWLKGVVTKFDWGVSTNIKLNVPAFEVLSSKMPVTFMLNIISLFVFIPVGFGLGIWAALKKDKATDNIIMIGVMIFRSVPGFVVMTILLYTFGYVTGLVPTQYPALSAPLALRIKGYIIPVLALSFGPIASLARMSRAELGEGLTSEYLLLAKTKGLNHKQSVLRHALRNSSVPLIPAIVGSFTSILTGSLIIEKIYGIPGTGGLLLQAIQVKDYNVSMVVLAFYGIISLTSILLVDILYGIVDPRIRVGRKK